jgi:hypothetical protein
VFVVGIHRCNGWWPSDLLKVRLLCCRGDPGDKKAMSAHRKQRQEALVRIEKEKEKWKKGQAARAKAAAEAARAAEAEERKHAAAKQQLEDKIAQ